MLTSMTGYGRAASSSPNGAVTVEIRSLNHRYFDVSLRMPREFSSVEERVRSHISERVARGRIEVSVSVEWRGESRSVAFDAHLARAYAEGLASLADALELEPIRSVDAVSRLPDVMTVSEAEVDADSLWEMLRPALSDAIDQVVEMRKEEGARLERDIASRIEVMEQTIDEVGRRAPEVVEAYRVKLARRVSEMIGDVRVDESRLATEVALFADRCDITEETVRFKSHIKQFRDTILESGDCGKKLDFIIQEMNREANTIAAKSQDSSISALAVEIKAELEKVREQVQNVE
ncbi:MAG: YicC family protein [Firmicutes bacterium]|nr:YicC family protein [Bacillota bacterium]MDD4336573.1 YicC family protein [Bacillota bacterium]MDD4792433.1 YicC family protein [Bacillota bacterium]